MKKAIRMKKTARLGLIEVKKRKIRRIEKWYSLEIQNQIDLFELIVLFDDIFMSLTPSTK